MRLSTFASLAKVSLASGIFGCVLSMGSLNALAEQACVRTSAGAKVCGELLPAEGGNLAQRQEENEFVFELQGCKRSGSTVVCDLLFTDLSTRSRNFSLHGKSRTPHTRGISSGGDEMKPLGLKVGQEETFQSNSPENTLVRGVPMRSNLTFKEFPRETSAFSVLEVGYSLTNSAGRWETGIVRFRNVSIQPK